MRNYWELEQLKGSAGYWQVTITGDRTDSMMPGGSANVSIAGSLSRRVGWVSEAAGRAAEGPLSIGKNSMSGRRVAVCTPPDASLAAKSTCDRHLPAVIARLKGRYVPI